MKLEDFCADRFDARTYLTKPFPIGNYLVASNGHWMAFIPTLVDCESDDIPAQPRKVISELISMNESVEFTPIPAFETPSPETCTTCKGDGNSETKLCHECDGDCYVSAENQYSTYNNLECKSCDGKGYITTTETDVDCEKCSGKGTAYSTKNPIDIDGLSMNPNYLVRVANLPNVKISINTDRCIMLFKSDSLSGCVMGMAS